MYRNFLILIGSALIIGAPATAQTRTVPIATGIARGGPMDVGPTRYAYSPPDVSTTLAPRFSRKDVELLVKWGSVGRCVVAKEHDASLTYIKARWGSAEAVAAAARLNPVFTSCMSGSGIANQSNKSLRRAALADALGVTLPA